MEETPMNFIPGTVSILELPTGQSFVIAAQWRDGVVTPHVPASIVLSSHANRQDAEDAMCEMFSAEGMAF
jgi:hypothetical protein